MASETYNVIFFGRIFPGQDPEQVRARVGEMFKISGARLDKLFSGARITVKKDLDLATAQRYRAAFQKAGALVELKKTEPAPDAGPSTPPPIEAPETAEPSPKPGEKTPGDLHRVELLPPRSGSLAEFSHEEAPVPIPDISHLDLDAAGADLDPDYRPPPPLELDLDGLDLDRPGADLDPEYRPPPPLQVNTDALSMSPANTGSLEDFARKETPVPLPDISGLKLDEESNR